MLVVKRLSLALFLAVPLWVAACSDSGWQAGGGDCPPVLGVAELEGLDAELFQSRPAKSQPATRPAAEKAKDRRDRARRITELNLRVGRLFEAREYSKCEPLLREILRLDPNHHVAWYNLACCHSRANEKEKAVQDLQEAVEHGYSDFRHLERDPDLDTIRTLESYRKLLERRDEIQRQRAEKVRQGLQREFGQDYLCEVDDARKLVFATNVDVQTLADMKERLTAYASAQWQDLFRHRFDRYLTIVIPKSSDWRWGAMGGFYNRAAHMLVARDVGLTLIHEFTHALHAADQQGTGQEHPIWITEGLATLFESSKVADGRVTIQHNRRLNMLQRIIQRRRAIPFKDLMNFTHPRFMQEAMTAYGQGRYMMMYLHEKGKLRAWYDAYVEGYDQDRGGAKAMEKVLGRTLAQIEEDWRKWVLGLEPPILRLPAGHAYLGIQLRPDVDGVSIVRVVPGSGADKAGLRVDDVIIQIGQERTIDPAELTDIIYAHEVGDQVNIRFRREGKYQETAVTLTEMPQQPGEPAAGTQPAPKTQPAAKTQPASGPAKPTVSRPAAEPAAQPAPATRPARKAPRKAA